MLASRRSSKISLKSSLLNENYSSLVRDARLWKCCNVDVVKKLPSRSPLWALKFHATNTLTLSVLGNSLHGSVGIIT